MMVTFVSQCEKNALKKTRRVLDAFANRIGDNTWQTLITEDGLQTVKKMLRQTASRSTAVSCHWIRSRSRSQLLWVVGNKNKFNSEGVVPVNSTEKDLLVKESFAINTEVIAYLSALAGFFHDIGKANQLFQNKLDENGLSLRYEPYRHEWISLRIFQTFVGSKTDQEWLAALKNLDNKTEVQVISELQNYSDSLSENIHNPFKNLPPIARVVAWLIVSHHKLPQYPKGLDNPPSLEKIDDWIIAFEPSWITPKSVSDEWTGSDRNNNWNFPFGTLFKSVFWQTEVANFANRVLKSQRVFDTSWHNNQFTLHLSRLSLMLADHAISSQKKADNAMSDRNYLAYANTDYSEEGQRYKKQKLDEHTIHVAKMAYQIACALPKFKKDLKSLNSVVALESKVPKENESDFGWQDKAAELASSIKEDTTKYGFFGICMASTGKGKTRANAKIMYSLSEVGNCRFNVALGLRTLSIQTAKALRHDLDLSENDVALLVGSQAVMDLQQISLEPEKSIEEDKGSQSAESLLKDEVILFESLELNPSEEISWLAHDEKILRLIHAPVLVSTIDYLIPASEGIKGGRQIAPMLRLMTSDLVLDEPDDFGLDDLPALCRLVNCAGMLGSRVLLSTATISPSLANTMFEAYQAGRKHYTQANGEVCIDTICCAWFDEHNKPRSELIQTSEQFEQCHTEYVNIRVKKLKKESLSLRKGKLVRLDISQGITPSMAIAMRIHQSILELHQAHSIELNHKQVSIGLVRIANINPLIQITKTLIETSAPEDTIIHYCVYHGQFPLLQRSSIEQILDKALKRPDKQEWIEQSGLSQIISGTPEKHHMFVVLATSVAEVGRDHDYDWAIVEPSSLRSIIQLAGRVQRHRKQTPQQENIHVLEQNFKGLKGVRPCFEKPGFESKKLAYASTNLAQLTVVQELKDINASSRVKVPGVPTLTKETPPRFTVFSELEHFAQMLRLKGNINYHDHAAQWWQHDVSWCGELQRIQPFRQSSPNEDYCLHITGRGKLVWQKKQPGSYPSEFKNTDDICCIPENVSIGRGISWWHQFDIKEEVEKLSQKLNKSEGNVLQTYSYISLEVLPENSAEQWQYHPQLGVYRNLKKDEYENEG